MAVAEEKSAGVELGTSRCVEEKAVTGFAPAQGTRTPLVFRTRAFDYSATPPTNLYTRPRLRCQWAYVVPCAVRDEVSPGK